MLIGSGPFCWVFSGDCLLVGSLDWVLLPLSRYGGGGVSCVLVRVGSLVSGDGGKTDILG